MSVALQNSYQRYKQASVETAPPERLLIMLYEGAIKFSFQTQKALEEKKYEEANRNNLRVQDILVELNQTLDHSYGEIPLRLSRLYDFYHRQMILANMKKDPELVQPVLTFLQNFRTMWEEAALLSKKG